MVLLWSARAHQASFCLCQYDEQDALDPILRFLLLAHCFCRSQFSQVLTCCFVFCMRTKPSSFVFLLSIGGTVQFASKKTDHCPLLQSFPYVDVFVSHPSSSANLSHRCMLLHIAFAHAHAVCLCNPPPPPSNKHIGRTKSMSACTLEDGKEISCKQHTTIIPVR